MQVVGVADPGRRGRLVQVDAIADLGEPAERVQDLLRFAEHLPEPALEVEREAADVGIRSRPRQHPGVGRDAHRRSSHVDVDRRRRHRWQLLELGRGGRVGGLVERGVRGGDLVLEDVDRDPDRVGCRGGSRLELLRRHGDDGAVGLLEVAPRAAVLITAAAGNTRDAQELLERDPAVRLELLGERPARGVPGDGADLVHTVAVLAPVGTIAGGVARAVAHSSRPPGGRAPRRVPPATRSAPPARAPYRSGRAGGRRRAPGGRSPVVASAAASRSRRPRTCRTRRTARTTSTRTGPVSAPARPPPARDEVVDGDRRAGGGDRLAAAQAAAQHRPLRRRLIEHLSVGRRLGSAELLRSGDRRLFVDVVGRQREQPAGQRGRARARELAGRESPPRKQGRPEVVLRVATRGEAERAAQMNVPDRPPGPCERLSGVVAAGPRTALRRPAPRGLRGR